MTAPASAQEPTKAPGQGPQSERERLEEVYSTLRPQAGTVAPEATPTGSLWERLKDRLIGEGARKEREKDFRRLREMARAVPRAAVNLANNAVRSTAEAGAGIADALGIGGSEAQQDQNREAAKSTQLVSEETMDRVLGARSDDKVAALTESVLQGIGSVALLRGAGLKNLVLTGAITDAVAFNPYEASISDAMAQHEGNIPVLSQATRLVGELGKVDADDGAVMARAKRVVEGSIVGKIFGLALDAVAAGTSKARAQAVLANPTAKPAERVAAEEAIKKADETIVAIQDGTHTPEGARVVARPNGDGTWRVEGVAENPVLLRKSSETKLGDQTQTTFTMPNGEEATVLWSKQEDGKIRVAFMGSTGGEGSLGPGNVRQVMRQLREESGATKVTGERVSGANPGREAERELPGPRMTRAEAETQAATMDHSLQQMDSPKGAFFTDADVKAHFETAERIKNAPTEREAIDIVGGEDHFNLGAIEDGEDFNAQLRALISRYQDSFDNAKGRPVITTEETIQAAESYAKELGMTDYLAEIGREANDPTITVKTVLKASALRQIGNRMTELAAVRAARPHDPAVMAELRRTFDVYQVLGLNTMGHRSDMGRAFNIMQHLSEDRIGKVRFKNDLSTRKVAEQAGAEPPKAKPSTNGTKPVPKPAPAVRLSDSMSDEEIDAYVRLFQRGGGEVRNLHATVKAMHAGMAEQAMKEAEKGKGARFQDGVIGVYLNALFSGARTAQAVAYSGMLMNGFEAAARTLGGAATLNKGMATEGAGQMYALFRYSWDNLKSAAMAYKNGGSVLTGEPPMNMKGGITGTLHAVSGRVLGSIDENTRVAAYRAIEFGKALRQAHESGLTGSAAVKRAEADVRMSIDPETGIALNPLALERANVATLSQALGMETAGGHIQAAINKIPAMKFIIPVVRPSVNVFRYVFENTPGLNRTSAKMRAVYEAGGEEAAALSARTAIVGSMMFAAWRMTSSGQMTGNGPSNLDLRKIWRENGNEPYSIMLPGWDKPVSYRRFEPFSSWLSVMADANEALNELEENGDQSLGNGFAAVTMAAIQNSYNKAWMTGFARVMDSMQESGDRGPAALGRIFSETAAGFVPAATAQFNDDPYLHEARGVVDKMRARIPGLSNDLPAKFNHVGEPIMKQGDLWNRNFAVAPHGSGVSKLLETTLLDNGIVLTPYPSKLEKGQIDLLDARWEKNGKLPYIRFMELVREQNLRKQLEDRIKQPDWKEMSPGSPTYPGGERKARLGFIKDRVEEAALRKVLTEYEKTGLRTAYQAARYKLRPLAKYRGPDAEAAAREKYGVPIPK
jgi:hypothetical protein